MSNTISIVGTVATHPRLITTSSGVIICSFRLASGERRFDRVQQKWIDGETNWFGVTAFRALAEHANLSFRKGERVIVTGRLRVRQWQNDEKSGTAVEIEADALGHDLRWGVSRFEKRIGAAGQAESGSEIREAGTEPAAWPGSAETDVHSPAEDPEGPLGADAAEAPTADSSGDGFLPVAA